MKRLFHRFLLMLAQATDQDLARQVQYLKVENQILRGKLPKRIQLAPPEKRRLLKFGHRLGSAMRQLISIVSHRTFLRWLHGDTPTAAAAKTGRPRTDDDLRELVLRLAREKGWGYTRIHGELKKLGLAHICRSTVVNILRAAGIDTAPQRGPGTWDDFLHRHAATLWACDFFEKKVWTSSGLVSYFVLFFLHIGSRRVHIAGMTPHPDQQWMAQQARNVSMFFGEQPVQPSHLIRDLDGKFTPQFDDILRSDGMKIVPVGPRSPNLNAHAERWVLSMKSECLNHFIVFGEAHLQLIVGSYESFYNEYRPHQSVGNVPLTGDPSPPVQDAATAQDVVCVERLGGLLKHYQHRAA